MRVIVTRPEREAQRWVNDLVSLGHDAVALPLIEVGPAASPADMTQAWQHMDAYVGVMFVSGNAVDYFFSSKPAVALDCIEEYAIKNRAWATGPGTAKALLRAGVSPDRLDVPARDAGQFDSESLWQVVGDQVKPGDRVLIVRGGDSVGMTGAGQGSGREWFANRVRQAGAQADFVMAYQRRVPELAQASRELARRAAVDGSVWLFSSTEAVANLITLLPAQKWYLARAVATHPRIALAAENAGFGVVCESRPTLPDVLASIESLG